MTIQPEHRCKRKICLFIGAFVTYQQAILKWKAGIEI
jgi:hypothetical protein